MPMIPTIKHFKEIFIREEVAIEYKYTNAIRKSVEEFLVEYHSFKRISHITFKCKKKNHKKIFLSKKFYAKKLQH